MPDFFQTPTWSVELPDGWSAAPQADHVAIRLPFPGAQLRITPYKDESGRLTAADWLRVTAHFDRRRGRPIIPRQCGDFAGHETRFDADGLWIRGWALLADEEGLDVNYRCATADTGRDDAQVDGVLSTLRIRRAAT